MINKILFHIFNIFKESPLSKDCLHKGSDTVPSITKYCHNHTVCFSPPHIKRTWGWSGLVCHYDSSVLLKTHHAQKRDQEDNRKMTSCFAGAQAWKKTKQSKLLICCLLHYFVLLEASVQVLCVLSEGSGLEHMITTSPRRLQANRCRVTVHPLI